jgi:RNA polymerase sigma-70 factor, ECF subfamily
VIGTRRRTTGTAPSRWSAARCKLHRVDTKSAPNADFERLRRQALGKCRDGFCCACAFTGVGFSGPSRNALRSVPTTGGVRASRSDGLGGFLALYDDSVTPLFRYLCRVCGGDRSLAEDLAQETFATALAQLKAGRVEEVSLAWLLVVARHEFIDHYRRAERERRKLTVVDPSSLGVSDERDGDLLAAVRGLPPAQRAAIVLRYVDDLSVRAVAEALGKSRRAAESLLSRGVRTLRATMSDGGFDV